MTLTQNKIRSQQMKHGFEVWDDTPRTYAPFVVDSGFELSHTTFEGLIQSIRFSSYGNTFSLDLSDAEDRSLMRTYSFDKNLDWYSLEASRHHGTFVGSVLTQLEIPLNLAGLDRGPLHLNSDLSNDILNNQPADEFKDFMNIEDVVNISIGNSLPNYYFFNERNAVRDYFAVFAAGNNNENYSTMSLESSQLGEKPIWTTQLTQNAIWVGGMAEADNKIWEKSATPGDNQDIQKRWITATAENILGAGSIYLGKSSVHEASGTSFAAPQVTAALSLAKSLCPQSMTRDLVDVLLETADRDFEEYTPDLYGMGILDNRAFKEELQAQCP